MKMFDTKEQKNSLYRGIKNAIKETIKVHGVIDENKISSLQKRIFGAIINHAKNCSKRKPEAS